MAGKVHSIRISISSWQVCKKRVKDIITSSYLKNAKNSADVRHRHISMLPRMNSVRIRRFSAPYFHEFGLNLRIQSECRKIRVWKTPNTDTFYAVYHVLFTRPSKQFHNKNFSDSFRNSLFLTPLKKLSHFHWKQIVLSPIKISINDMVH